MKRVLKYLFYQIRSMILFHQLRITLSKRKIKKLNKFYSLKELHQIFKTRNLKYKYFHHMFWNLAPNWLQEHRKYFARENRGFGEDAFHAMWFYIFKDFRPKNILEIGIYRGQTISLFSLLSRNFNFETEIHGVSPFTSAGDNVSSYLIELDYYNDVIKNFDYFKLPLPAFHKGFSTEAKMINMIQSKLWDLIYIDGNHDYDVAKQDFIVSSENIRKGGLIILDDSALYTDYNPAFYSTAGHPGPSKVVGEIDTNKFEEILSVGHNRVFQKK